jgi:predicted metal-binding protein
MVERAAIEERLRAHGIDAFRWIEPRKIVVAQWVRMKCMFGCVEYGRNACCPPSTPSVDECARFFSDYEEAVLIRFHHAVAQPEDRHAWSREINGRLLEVERAVFLAGHPKAFMLFMDSCSLCEPCAATRRACKEPRAARPSPEALAVDVFSTVRAAGFPIEVLADYAQPMNRYALLLVA